MFSVNSNYDSTINFIKEKALDRSTVNIGDLKWSILSHDTNGWLLCNGRSLQIADYPLLYQIIGTTFGQSDPASFNLPDSRGRVLGAVGQGNGLTNRVIGQSIGEETHTLTIPEIPSHDHSGVTGDTSLTISPSSVVTNVSYNTERTTALPGLSETLVTSVSSSSTNVSVNPNPHHHTVTSQGGSQPHNNMQPTLFIGNVMIFAGYNYDPMS